MSNSIKRREYKREYKVRKPSYTFLHLFLALIHLQVKQILFILHNSLLYRYWNFFLTWHRKWKFSLGVPGLLMPSLQSPRALTHQSNCLVAGFRVTCRKVHCQELQDGGPWGGYCRFQEWSWAVWKWRSNSNNLTVCLNKEINMDLCWLNTPGWRCSTTGTHLLALERERWDSLTHTQCYWDKLLTSNTGITAINNWWGRWFRSTMVPIGAQCNATRQGAETCISPSHLIIHSFCDSKH